MYKNDLGIYGYEIKNYGLLDLQSEKELIRKSSNGDIESRNNLVTSNLYLVIKIASKYKNLGVEFDELVCEGNKGLIVAANKFNPKMDNKFATYAYFWIRQAILSALNNNNEWNSLSKNNVLNYEYYDDKDLSVDMNSFEEDAEEKKLNDIIRVIDGLPKREMNIVKHYFGISGYTEMNTTELSKKYNISAMRVSAILEESIKKIRCGILDNNLIL